MKWIAFSILFTFCIGLSSQNPFEKPKPVPVPPEEIHTVLEDMPEFPGGPEAMQKYLEENIVRPTVMRGACSSRRLIAGFVVEKDGSITNIQIVKSINGCPDFDFDVIRVIKTMPKWRPGKLKGKYVRSFYKMPVYIS